MEKRVNGIALVLEARNEALGHCVSVAVSHSVFDCL